MMLRDHLAFAGLATVGLLITVIALAIGYDIYSDDPVNQSFWNEAISGIAPWYAAGIGVYLMVVTFPQYVLYGDTRKRFAQRVALFSVPFCAGLSLLVVAALWVERLVYRVAGWNHAIADDHLYDSATDIPAILLEFFVVMLPWFAFGALLGATYVGRQELFFIALPAAIVGVAIVNILLGLDDGPTTFFNRWFDRAGENAALGVAVSLAFSAAALYGVRLITRSAAIPAQAE